MPGRSWILGALALGLLAAAPAWADDAPWGVVRLRDGTTLTGHVRTTPQGIEIERPSGVRLTVPHGDVVGVDAAADGPVRPAGTVWTTPNTETVPTVAAVDRAVARATATDQAATACSPCPPEPDPCPSPWHFRGGLALGLGQGNSDFFDLKLDAEVERDPTPWGWKVSLTYVYGEKEDEKTADNWRVLGRVDRALTGRSYVFGQVLFERDLLADLEYRITPTVGYGYTVVDTAKDTLKLEAGLGATIEKRTDLEETFDPSGWFAADWEHRFDECRKLQATYDFRPNFGDFDLSKSTLQVRYLTPCFSIFNLEVALRLDHVIDPPGDIEPLDLLFTVGLRVEI